MLSQFYAPFAIATRPARAITAFRRALAVAKQRRALARLDARQLDDIGLTRRDAITESQQPFWDVPGFWRH